MKIITTTRFDLSGAIEHATALIHAGYRATFINTQFGMIGFEVNQSYDPLNPVAVCEWKDAPDTQWYLRNRKLECNYYASIGFKSGQRMELTKLEVARVMCNCMMRFLTGAKYLSFEDSDPILLSYIKDSGETNIPKTVDGIVSLMESRDVNPILKLNRQNTELFRRHARNSIRHIMMDTENKLRCAEKHQKSCRMLETFWCNVDGIVYDYMNTRVYNFDGEKYLARNHVDELIKDYTAIPVIALIKMLVNDSNKTERKGGKNKLPVLSL